MSVTLIISSGVLVVDDFAPWSPIQVVTRGSSASPGQITRDSAWNVVSCVSSGDRVQLPADAQIGDVYEVYDGDWASPGGCVLLLPSTSERVFTGFNPPQTETFVPRTIRKLSSVAWGVATDNNA